MDYGHENLGPALMRLRKAAGLRQDQVGATIGRTGATVSRLEQPGSNPNASSLLRFLTAIGTDLGDLHRELREPGDALEETVANVDQRLRDEPEYRRLARAMLERFGGPELPPALGAIADLIDRQGDQIEQQADQIGQQSEQMEEVEERLRRLEEGLPPTEGEEPREGPDGGPAEQ